MSFWGTFHNAFNWCLWYARFPTIKLTKAEFDDLLEYSCTMPTGVFPGKRWKRNDTAYLPGATHDVWLLGEYLPSDKDPDNFCKTRWSLIEIVG